MKKEQIKDIALQSNLLRVMAANYTSGHRWDHLDSEAVIKAADSIDALLAAHEQEPVGFDELRDAVAEVSGVSPIEWRTGLYPGHHEVPFINFNSLRRIVDKFTHPAPSIPAAVPDECPAEIRDLIASHSDALFHDGDAQEIWNACRAAMLNHPSNNQDSHAAAVGEEIKQPSSNYAVIPDGYVLVPIEPTEHMVVEGFESEPDKFFSEPEVWAAYQAMSGCRKAAHRARLCWAAMIAAAPKEA